MSWISIEENETTSKEHLHVLTISNKYAQKPNTLNTSDIMLNNPFHALYDDSDYHYTPSYQDQLRYQQMQKRDAEAARQAEMNRYYQMKRNEQERQRKLATLRLAKQEEERRRAVQQRQQKDEYHRKLEMQRNCRQQEELRRQILNKSQQRHQEEEQEDEWTFIRGRDGRLYRVALKNSDDTDSDSDIKERILNRVRAKQRTTHPITKVPQQPPPIRELAQDTRRDRFTVTVEDASDDESEQDPFKSVWNNRRPSPGQWMEPVMM